MKSLEQVLIEQIDYEQSEDQILEIKDQAQGDLSLFAKLMREAGLATDSEEILVIYEIYSS